MFADVLFACVPVSDLQASLEWYALLFGRPHDITVNDDEVMWQVAETGWLYILSDPDRAGGTVVSLAVTDLASTLSGMLSRGLDGAPVEEVEGGAGWKAKLTDPDGNQVALIEVRQSGPGV
jgi:predicted enzyme related to lactoylglutathione lyase